MDNKNKSTRHYRTLIRVEAYDIAGETIKVIIPGWNPHEIVEFQTKDIPEIVLTRIKEGYVHFHCHIFLAADKAEELNPILWESE